MKTIFLPFIFTLFIFLHYDIFLVKIPVINEAANPDLRKHTQIHVLYTLQIHGPTGCSSCCIKPNQYLRPPSTPLWATKSAGVMQSLCICGELQRDMLYLTYCATRPKTAKQLKTPLSHKEAKAKTEEWGKFNLKENIVLICFTTFVF